MNDSDMSLYQLGVSASIEQRIIRFARPSEEKHEEIMREYENRINNLIRTTPFWKEDYSKIMLQAYKGIKQKYGLED
jgi:hypothetical protein